MHVLQGSELCLFIPRKMCFYLACGSYLKFQENLEMELHKCIDDAAFKVNVGSSQSRRARAHDQIASHICEFLFSALICTQDTACAFIIPDAICWDGVTVLVCFINHIYMVPLSLNRFPCIEGCMKRSINLIPLILILLKQLQVCLYILLWC